jgi:hypothetical protein
MKYVNPITDRDAADIVNRTAKAFLNILDWNRIYGNAEITNFLAEFLIGITITFDSVTAPTITNFPAVADFNALLANVNRVRAASNLPEITGLNELAADWIAGINQAAPDYLDVNEWEQVIEILRNTLVAAADYRAYCGVFNVGQPRFWQNRFRRFAWVANSITPVRRARTNVAACGVGLTRNNGFRRYD